MEVAKQYGASNSILVENIEKFDRSILKNIQKLGITASASAPEVLVENFINKIKKKVNVNIKEVEIIKENVIFKTPGKLN